MKMLDVLKNQIRHLAAYHGGRQIVTIRPERPTISFSFDDVAESAFSAGDRLLQKYQLAGTYYLALGLLGTDTNIGRIIGEENVIDLYKRGNEIGCHTFDHLDAWTSDPFSYEDSILKNAVALEKLIPGLQFKTFAYPKGSATQKTKKICENHFCCSRGIKRGINKNRIDLNLLNGHSIYGDMDSIGLYKKIVDRNKTKKGWLIFYTHDVRKNKSRYGCTPQLLEEIVSYSIKSGAEIKTVYEAYISVLATRLDGALPTRSLED